MNIPQLTDRVRRFFTVRAGEFGLNPDRVEARYVLNWGGFVNHSFTITDGERVIHLKLAEQEDCRDALQRWMSFHDRLESHYRAPRLLRWINLYESGCEGLLLEHFNGLALELERDRQLLPDIIDVIRRLHHDEVLSYRLRDMDDVGSCAGFFASTYIERFDEDLDLVEADCPDFVSPETLDWMRRETRRLEACVRETAVFDRPADSPVHSDLWANNVLVNDRSDWRIIDWDDITLGDPANDYLLLFWPLLREKDGRSGLDLPIPSDDPELFERIDLYRRAVSLDGVIDVLADYLDAPMVPAEASRVQEVKRREHLDALARYRNRYGGE